MRRLALPAIILALPAYAQDSELLVFDYSGFEDPAYHGAYVEAHGASPEFTFFGDEDEAFQKISTGFNADVTHICAGSVSKFTESGLIEPWDTSRIDAYGDLDSNLTGQDVAGGETYFIPLDYGTTAVAYNMDEVPAEDVASLQIFQNPNYAGRLTIPDNVDDAFALAYLATGVTDWSEATDEQFEAAADWLRAVHPNLRTYWVDPGELSQLMASGEILAAWAWNETFPTLTEMDFPVGFQREPAEGSSVWLCGYVNNASGQGSEDKAYDFINAMLAPASTQPLLDAGYGHSNAASMGEIDAESLASVGLGEIAAPVLAQLPVDPAMRERMSETFERIKAGF